MPSSATKPAVSVIVPVFNVGQYIEQGLDSLLEQNFRQGYEVILIDDASTDGSVDVCKRYVGDYPDRFTLVECEVNSGVSVARNLGLDRAKGRYLAFFDPDDILPPQALSRLFAAAERHQADIVKGNLVLFDERERKPAPDSVETTKLLEGDEVLTALYEHSQIRGHIAGKLLRRDRLGEIRLPVGVRMAQDLLYFSEVFARARSLVLLDEDVYHYRKHGTGSTGRKYEKGSYIDWLDAVEKTGEFAASMRQRRAYRGLLLRSITQIAREARKISPVLARPVLQEIEKRVQRWDLNLRQLLLRDRLGLRSLSRYVKLQLALVKIRQNLSQS